MFFTLLVVNVSSQTVTNIVNEVNITNITNVVNVTTHTTFPSNQRQIILPPDEMMILQEHMYLSPNQVRSLEREAMLKQRQKFFINKIFPKN